MEIWKDMVGFEGLYQVSNLGNVKRLSKKRYCGHKGSKPQKLKEKNLKPFLSFGYKRVRLYKNNKHKDYSVHRLVIENFIPNLKNLPQANHIDGNKLNNHVNNLEWVTHSENTKHAIKTGLLQDVSKYGKKTQFKKGNIPWNKRINKKDVMTLIKKGKSKKEISSILECCLSTVYCYVNDYRRK